MADIIWAIGRTLRARQAERCSATGYRVKLWKSERGQCLCEETIIFVTVKGMRE